MTFLNRQIFQFFQFFFLKTKNLPTGHLYIKPKTIDHFYGAFKVALVFFFFVLSLLYTFTQQTNKQTKKQQLSRSKCVENKNTNSVESIINLISFWKLKNRKKNFNPNSQEHKNKNDNNNQIDIRRI